MDTLTFLRLDEHMALTEALTEWRFLCWIRVKRRGITGSELAYQTMKRRHERIIDGETGA